MKILIWAGCLFIATLANTALGYFTGLKIGYLFFYLFVYFAAKNLCDRWDAHQAKKATANAKPNIDISTNNEEIPMPQNQPPLSNLSGNIEIENSLDTRNNKHTASTNDKKVMYHLNKEFGNAEAEEDEKASAEPPKPVNSIFYCRKCGSKLIEGAKFCNKCGTEILICNTDKDHAPLKEESNINISQEETDIQMLALKTVDIAESFIDHHKEVNHFETNLIKCDISIFGFFVIRAVCIMSASNREKSLAFNNTYTDSITSLLRTKYETQELIVSDMFDNRVDCYERVFASESDLELKLQALVNNFENIVKVDLSIGKYAPFYETSPLPLLSALENIQLHTEILTLYREIPSLLAPYFMAVKDNLD